MVTTLLLILSCALFGTAIFFAKLNSTTYFQLKQRIIHLEDIIKNVQQCADLTAGYKNQVDAVISSAYEEYGKASDMCRHIEQLLMETKVEHAKDCTSISLEKEI